MNQPEKISGNSMDIAEENRSRLKELFPAVFTEVTDDKGNLTQAIDFEKLKAELGKFSEVFESRRERYGMDWPGKKDAMKLIQTTTSATLKPCREESVNFDDTENLYLEGDNLEVLKLLQKSYYGKVKMIYIDPPYNTGNEFIYPDNYTENLETYLQYAGLVDNEGRKFSTNTANEGRFHTKWLNMMYPRLYLARNLLRDDGVIFISIDDNEVTNLRKICDEVFGEENFVANFLWKKKSTTSNVQDAQVSSQVDYQLLYRKSEHSKLKQRVKLAEQRLYPNNDEEGNYRTTVIEKKDSGSYKRETMKFDILGHTPREGKRWQIGKDRAIELENKNRFFWDGEKILLKIYDFEDNDTFSAQPNLLDNHGSSDGGAKLANIELFNTPELFDTPKPIELIKYFVDITAEKYSIVLDFFSGSSTTAHAVMQLNAEDGGNRKFIMVQLPEPCDESSEAHKAGYKTIAEIGKERIRRAIKKLGEEKASDKQTGLFEEQENQKVDLGFKVFKLDKSNFKQWQKLAPDSSTEKIAEQLELSIFNVEEKATPEDLLYEILLKVGLTLTEKISTETIAGKTVYSINGGSLLLCLENQISRELIDQVIKLKPMQFICLDSAFEGNDQLKVNVVQTFSAYNLETEKHNQIIFKTV